MTTKQWDVSITKVNRRSMTVETRVSTFDSHSEAILFAHVRQQANPDARVTVRPSEDLDRFADEWR